MRKACKVCTRISIIALCRTAKTGLPPKQGLFKQTNIHSKIEYYFAIKYYIELYVLAWDVHKILLSSKKMEKHL